MVFHRDSLHVEGVLFCPSVGCVDGEIMTLFNVGQQMMKQLSARYEVMINWIDRAMGIEGMHGVIITVSGQGVIDWEQNCSDSEKRAGG